MLAVLLSTYDLGRQPYGLASPAAWLREAGFDVRMIDLAIEPLDEAAVRLAGLVAFHLPMHTATRLAAGVLPRVRAMNREARIVCYGLYAPHNGEFLRSLGADEILGGEFEEDLVAIARGTRPSPPTSLLPRLAYRVPDRAGLPSLDRYARLVDADGQRRVVGSTESTRGCKHTCRHCPVVPVYEGRFRAVPRDIVLEDVRRQVAAGAEHITFGDPDFWNGPTHAMAIVRSLHEEHPRVTYDATIKIEHLIHHAEHLPTLAATGCVLVTSAAESIDDTVLARLAKGHTRADLVRAIELCRRAGLVLQPTFIAFHPWIDDAGYRAFLAFLDEHDLIDAVPPIQLALRLLIPAGSKLLDLAETRALVGPFDAERLVHPWRHPDARVDALADQVRAAVEEGSAAGESRAQIFDRVWRVTGGGPRTSRPSRSVPHLTEAWYCCAEPVEGQLSPL